MRIGTIDIEKPLLLAPMEDVTDQAFRIVCKRLGADIVFTEFVNSEGLVRNSLKTKKKMDFREEERPFGIQIYGGEEPSMEGAASIAESLHPNIIDINCGCWVRNVVGCGAGSGLLRDIPKMERIISAVIKTVKLPVTVKTRLGWDAESIKIVEIARMVEQTGAAALTIHCRTRSQAHKGDADFSWIPKVKSAVSIPIIANGSLDTPQKIVQAFQETGCDGVMIGRGAIENPWIYQQTKHFLTTNTLLPAPTVEERFRVLIEHLKLSTECKGERKGVIEFRKHYSGYLKGLYGASKVRQEMMQYFDLEPAVQRLFQYKEYLLAYAAVQTNSGTMEAA
ncbi:MAG: tRNA dihydrouridine synthase DusB [Ignavibacteriales bacterium]|nr:tRNA dihydrouridine synthase DusB [Ignavibacteriales bacterium]